MMQIFIILAILSSIQAKFILELDADSINEQALKRDPYIQVEGTSKHFNIDQYDITHLKYTQVGKNKRKTYETFIRKYKKITNCLVKYQIIPHQTSMIHSAISMNFNSKKRVWEFSRVFVIYSDNVHLNQVLRFLQPYKLATLKERVMLAYLNQKLLAIKAFTSAKTKLQKFMQKKLKSMEIVYIADIEIKGKKFVNEQILQSQIKNQNNYSKHQAEMVIVSNQNKGKDKKQQASRQFNQEEAQITVLFKIGNRSEDLSSNVQHEENVSDQSQHDDEEDDDGQVQISPQGQIQEEL